MPISLFPLHTIPAEDAVTRIIAGTCHVVMEHDRVIKTPSLKMKWPSVIARVDTDIAKEGIKLDNESLYYRDHGKCQYCSTKISMGELTRDHVHPKSKGGKFIWENIVTACPVCNVEKGDALPGTKTIDRNGKVRVWLPIKKPIKPSYYQLLEVRKKFPITVDDPNWVPFLGNWEGQINIKNAPAF
jgi:5-methylcytosine-specific restriction endonuclease McrA